MENGIQTGVYEDLITNGLRVELSNAPSSLVASEQNIDDAFPDRFWTDYVYDRDGHKKHEERIDNGILLFGKYYRGLWD